MGILPGLFPDHELMKWKNSFLLMSRLSSTSSSSIPCLLETLIQEDDDVRHCTKLHFRKLRLQKAFPCQKYPKWGFPCTLRPQMHQRSSIPEDERRGGNKQKDRTRKAAVVDI